MQMDPADMSKMLTQFNPSSPMSPKRSPVASPGGHALLPPPAREATGKRCLVIDLDETLVHTERQQSGFPGGKCDFKISVTIGAATYNMYVKKRPGCDEFLKRAAENYELIIFTASMEPYCKAVMDRIDVHNTVSHCLHRTHCTFWQNEIYVKDLSRLGRPIENTILLDNNPDCYLFQPENAIPINSWYDDESDQDLEHVLGILDAIAKSQDSTKSTLKEIDSKLGWGRVPGT
jgi:RNA polymerase II subunit A small phosphatase-like protein